jgi:hypothetical protein
MIEEKLFLHEMGYIYVYVHTFHLILRICFFQFLEICRHLCKTVFGHVTAHHDSVIFFILQYVVQKFQFCHKMRVEI